MDELRAEKNAASELAMRLGHSFAEHDLEEQKRELRLSPVVNRIYDLENLVFGRDGRSCGAKPEEIEKFFIAKA